MTEQRHRETLATVADTEAFGARIGRGLRAGDLVIADGPLGAGKTALTRGVAAGLGVAGPITSPTFVIARTHPPSRPGRPGLVHVDAYRLGLSAPDSQAVDLLDELDALDIDTDLTDSVVVVEWGAGLAERLAARHLSIRLRRHPDSDERTVDWGWVTADSGV